MSETIKFQAEERQSAERIARATVYELLGSHEFHSDILNEMARAEKRVWVQTMDFSHGQYVEEFIEGLAEAAERVDTRFRLDQYAMTAIGDLPTSISRHIPLLKDSVLGQLGARKDLLNKFPEGVVRIPVATPLQRVIPYVGTDHKKMYIVDEVAYIGGVNVSESGFDGEDFMIKTRKIEIVNALAMVFRDQDSFSDDFSLRCGDTTELLVDIGHPGKSLIMDVSRKIVSAARERVQIVSPFDPFLGLRESMENAAGNGAKVEVVTQETHKSPVWKIVALPARYQRRKALQRTDIELLHPPRATHSKLCIVDSRIAIFGSHNFASLGVKSGTKELSVITEDPNLVDLLSDYLDNLLSRSRNIARQPGVVE